MTLTLVKPEPIEEVVETEAEPGYEFDGGFQDKIAALALRDSVFNSRTEGLIKSDYFENQIDGILVKIALDFYDTYKKPPDKTLWVMVIKDALAKKTIRKDLIPEIKDRLGKLLSTSVSDRNYVIDKVAAFARDRAMDNALLKAIELKDRGDYDGIKKVMDAALIVGAAQESSSYNYWDEIDNRTTERIDTLAGIIKPDGITTGYKDLDNYLWHKGWGRKELSIIMGAAKAGKSMSLGDFAKNASLAGHNVLYVTLEVASKIIAQRTDANVAEIAMRSLGDHPHDVKKKIDAMRAKGTVGQMWFEEFPSGTFTPTQLRRLIQRYRAKGIIFDLIAVDYADIMAPDRRHDDIRNEFREIYLMLRAIACEENVAMLSATQTNREGAKAAVAKMTDIAEDFNKVRTADILLSINSTPDERAAGEARLYFAAVRNGESDFSLRIKQNREQMKFITKILGRE